MPRAFSASSIARSEWLRPPALHHEDVKCNHQHVEQAQRNEVCMDKWFGDRSRPRRKKPMCLAIVLQPNRRHARSTATVGRARCQRGLAVRGRQKGKECEGVSKRRGRRRESSAPTFLDPLQRARSHQPLPARITAAGYHFPGAVAACDGTRRQEQLLVALDFRSLSANGGRKAALIARQVPGLSRERPA